MEFRIHWLTVTIWGTEGFALMFWEEWLQKFLGPLQGLGFGGRGFRKRYEGFLASKVYVQPVNIDPSDQQEHYLSIELPGSACDAIPDKDFQILMIVLSRYEKFRVTRLDLAWDGLNCHPNDFCIAVMENRVRSLTKRESLFIQSSPLKSKDNGDESTTSVRFGSRQSERSVQFYDKRGYTRMELETKQNRADAIAREVLVHSPEEWPQLAVAHLRDFMDVYDSPELETLEEWWQELLQDIPRANKTLANAREVELNKIIAWIDNQVSPALSVLADVIGEDSIDAFIIDGRRKRGPKYRGLIEAKKLAEKEEEAK